MKVKVIKITFFHKKIELIIYKNIKEDIMCLLIFP